MADPQSPKSFPTQRYGAIYKPTGTLSSAAQNIKDDPLGAIHSTLATLGLAPAAGMAADLIDMGLYSVEAMLAKTDEARAEAKKGMAMAGLAFIPITGWGTRAVQAGKALKKSADEVKTLAKEAEDLALEAEKARKAGGSDKVLREYDQKFEDIIEVQIPKAQEQFKEVLEDYGEVINGKKGIENIVQKEIDRVKSLNKAPGMSAKDALKWTEGINKEITTTQKNLATDIKNFKQRVRIPAQGKVTRAEQKVAEAKSDFAGTKYKAESAMDEVDDFVAGGGTTAISKQPDPTSMVGALRDPAKAARAQKTAARQNLINRDRKHADFVAGFNSSRVRNRYIQNPNQVLFDKFGPPPNYRATPKQFRGEIIPAGPRRAANEVTPMGPRRDLTLEAQNAQRYSSGNRGSALSRGAKTTGALAGLAGVGTTAKYINESLKTGNASGDTSGDTSGTMEFKLGEGGIPGDTSPVVDNTGSVIGAVAVTPEGQRKMTSHAAGYEQPALITTKPEGQKRMMEAQKDEVTQASPSDYRKRTGMESRTVDPSVLTEAAAEAAKVEEGRKIAEQTAKKRTEGLLRGREIAEQRANKIKQDQELADRRAKGTGTPRGAGLAYLRTNDERLNRIEEGQKSLQEGSLSRTEAMRNARRRMEEVKTFQKGRAQYYKDIFKDPRGLKVPTADGGTKTIPRRRNPYMVGPAPDSKGFETEADAERIRNIKKGEFASILDEDKDKDKKNIRKRSNLLRKNR
jgi:hypothetical protein